VQTSMSIGRVELDPMRVPAPARSGVDDVRSFERDLDDSLHAGADDVTRDSRRDAHTQASEPTPTPQNDSAPAAPHDPTTAPAHGDSDHPPVVDARSAPAGPHGTPDAEAPVRRIETARGAGATATDSNATSNATSLDVRAATSATATTTVARGVTPTTVAGIATAQTAANGAHATSRAFAVDAKSAIATTRAHAPEAPAGYRSLQPGTMRMAEQARDSVFRQIAMRIVDGTGEVRVLLDPPELGQLDVQMTVEKGGGLRLSIGAERPELVLMLDKHMHELRQSLTAQGLNVLHADVHAGSSPRDDARRSHDGRDAHGAARPAANEETTGLDARLRGGVVTGDGIEWWV
jgi:flagellar hook-length control protein FliK